MLTGSLRQAGLPPPRTPELVPWPLAFGNYDRAFELVDLGRQALNSLDVHGMTVTEVKGYGRQKGHSEIYRGTEYAVHFLPKLKIEIAVDDAQSDAIVSAIRESAQTGRIGDGKIFVLDLLAVTRIRTGETGAAAL